MQFNDTQPIWLQIYDYACRAILAGRWTEQARIPSVRELAVTLEVNPNTVMRAYDKLETDGVIITRRGMGFFVTEGAAGTDAHSATQSVHPSRATRPLRPDGGTGYRHERFATPARKLFKPEKP